MKKNEITLESFSSDNDSKTVGFGIDSDNNVVARLVKCVAKNCNCMGSWIQGNQEWVTSWVYERDFVK
jgi:hypothetical protein